MSVSARAQDEFSARACSAASWPCRVGGVGGVVLAARDRRQHLISIDHVIAIGVRERVVVVALQVLARDLLVTAIEVRDEVGVVALDR